MSESIGVGIAGFPFETSSDFFKWVELCEAGDVDSIWTSDRLVSDAINLEPLALMAVVAPIIPQVLNPSYYKSKVSKLSIRPMLLT